MIFGSIIAAGVIGVLIAPIASRMLRFFPPVVTGTIILVIGITLMRVGINWIFGVPVGPTAPHLVSPEHAAWLEQVTALGGTVPPPPAGFAAAPTMDNPAYAPISNIILSLIVLGVVMVIARFAKGFLSNIAVLLGIITGGVIAAALGMMHFDKIAEAAWFAPITPFHFGTPIFEPVLIVTMTLVMIVTLIEFDGHVPRALRSHRHEARPSRAFRPGCGWTGSARSSAGCSTPSPTRRSRRTSGSSASPASARATSAWPAASSWWCSG